MRLIIIFLLLTTQASAAIVGNSRLMNSHIEIQTGAVTHNIVSSLGNNIVSSGGNNIVHP